MSVRVDLEEDTLVIEIRDDGVGGADATRGTGLTGLLDRVDAANGSLTIISAPGEGTAVHAELPVDIRGAQRAPADALQGW